MNSSRGHVEQNSQPLDRPTALRWELADLLLKRADVIVADTVALFPLSSPRRLEADYCLRLGHVFVRLIADAVRAEASDARSGTIVDLIALIHERGLTPEQVFNFAYLCLTSALDEISLDPHVGATSDLWPRVSTMTRKAVFDVLAAWTARSIDAPTEVAITDVLTTLHTRPVLDAALAKESYRAERFAHWLSLIMFDVDNLSDINRAYGYGVGDRVLERLGILLRSYFRQHDWVARYSEDTIAVLLPETSPEDALPLAERARLMVQERLTFRDHRTDQRVEVSVSTAVVSARAAEGEPVDVQRVLAEAEAATVRAKVSGRNVVEHVPLTPPVRPRTDP
jgi:diguanylate cyclase (GGDEF)-like protein